MNKTKVAALLASATPAGLERLASLRMEGPTPEEQLKAVIAEFKVNSDKLKGFAETAQAEIKNLGKMSDATKLSVDQLLANGSAIDARFLAIEQALTRREPGVLDAPKTLGTLIADDKGVKELANGGRGKARVSVPRNLITSLPASAGVLVSPDRNNTIIPMPRRRMTVRDLLTPGRTGSNLVEYIKEEGFTNAARPVTEGGAKPESNITFEESSAPVRTIAHWVRATKQILSDAAQLGSYIDGRLRFGLEYEEELQLLKGSGAGQNLEGILTVAQAYAAPFTPASPVTMIDVLRLALLQSELAEFPATGIVMHPIDWARIELLKDAEERYLWSNPLSQNGSTLWGRPVVGTQAMDEDQFLVGAFQIGAQIFDRETADVLVSTEDADNFTKNLVTILAEERLALAIYREEAFVEGDFGNVT